MVIHTYKTTQTTTGETKRLRQKLQTKYRDGTDGIPRSPFRSSKEDWCRTRLQWYCGAEFGTPPFVLFPNSAPQCC